MGKMRGGLFDYNGRTIVRVDRRIARRAYDNGYTILLCPVNMNPGNCWGFAARYNRDDYNGEFYSSDAFNRIAFYYELYNCNHETGRYPAFYIFEDETRGD